MQQSLQLYVTVAASQEGSWPKFWDHALDKGAAGTSSALALLKLLTLIPYNGICPIKGCKATIEDDTAAAHFPPYGPHWKSVSMLWLHVQKTSFVLV